MFKIFKLLFVSLIFSLTIALFLAPSDPAWVKCSDEKDLYRYVSKGWNVDKILRNGDISYSDTGHKLYYLNDEPQIHLSKGNSIKVLNFGWRCWFEQGPENNLTKKDELGP